MIETIAGVFRSFCVPSHYNWVAHDKSGLEMTYLFILSMILVAAALGWGEYYASKAGISLVTLLQTGLTGSDIFTVILKDLSSSAFLFFPVLAALWSISLMFSLLNMGIVCAIYGQVFNFLFQSELNFCQLVRVCAHAQIPAFVVGFIAMYNVHLFFHSAFFPWVFVSLGLSYTLYIIFAVTSAKF